MIYQLRPAGAGYGGGENKNNNEAKASERSQKWLTRNPRSWRSPPLNRRSWQAARQNCRRLVFPTAAITVRASAVRVAKEGQKVFLL